MQADGDKALHDVLLPHVTLCAGGEGEADVFSTEDIPVAGSLADFARRVRMCESARVLEMLHSMMLRTVPVRQRADYIALLNQRDEEMSFQNPATET